VERSACQEVAPEGGTATAGRPGYVDRGQDGGEHERDSWRQMLLNIDVAKYRLQGGLSLPM